MSDLLLIYWFVPPTGEAYDFIGVMRQVEMPMVAFRSHPPV